MIKCICVDNGWKSRKGLRLMIKQIRWLQLVRDYKTIDEALAFCKERPIDILFVHLNPDPLSDEDILRLKEIQTCETKIVVLSSNNTIARGLKGIGIVNHVNVPVTSRRLWTAAMYALKIKDFGTLIPGTKTWQPASSQMALAAR